MGLKNKKRKKGTIFHGCFIELQRVGDRVATGLGQGWTGGGGLGKKEGECEFCFWERHFLRYQVS